MGGQHRADGHTLLLTTGELDQCAIPEFCNAQQIQSLLHPLAHDVWRDGQLLHHVGELVLHRVGHESGQGVLTDHADHVRQLPWLVRPRVAAVNENAPRQGAACEVRNEPVDGAEQGRLPDPGTTDDKDELTLIDVEIDVTQDR